MKILLGYSEYRYPIDIGKWTHDWLERLRSNGIDVQGFCLTLDPPGPRLNWKEIDARWRRGEKKLMALYEDLANQLLNYDVFVNFNGINLHPDFVRQLPTFNVFGCFDDPESSQDLSYPVAWAYDLAMVGNIASLTDYKKWGVKEVRFWPLGFRADDYDPSLTREKILKNNRNVNITLICERTSPWRKERLDKFYNVFPEGSYYGHGWPNGFIAEKDRVPLLQKTKIGLNIHNSTGPVNFRTFILPANGVMQICDNKEHLGKLFELNKEVVGFSTIEEAIELSQYYLKHEEERLNIAVAGWERTLRDYNEVSVFKLMLNYVEVLHSSRKKPLADPRFYLISHKKNKLISRGLYRLQVFNQKIVSIVKYLKKLFTKT